MLLANISETLQAKIIHKSTQFDSSEIQSVIVSDLMSDVLMTDQPSPVLLSSLSTDQTIRTASMIDALGVIITQNKPLPQGIDSLAEELDITLLHTHMDKFDACILLGTLMGKCNIKGSVNQ
ncbi:DRTGG domain-containing protein [Chitinispirillum alkaliphilum]|nr:DRTGG domain-containing protein [Chitinispirillum alkaliphilum]